MNRRILLATSGGIESIDYFEKKLQVSTPKGLYYYDNPSNYGSLLYNGNSISTTYFTYLNLMQSKSGSSSLTDLDKDLYTFIIPVSTTKGVIIPTAVLKDSRSLNIQVVVRGTWPILAYDSRIQQVLGYLSKSSSDQTTYPYYIVITNAYNSLAYQEVNFSNYS